MGEIYDEKLPVRDEDVVLREIPMNYARAKHLLHHVQCLLSCFLRIL